MAGVMQKSCKACGKHHPINAMRCRSCGARMIGVQPVLIETTDLESSASTVLWTCEYCNFEQNEVKDEICKLCERVRELPTDEQAPPQDAAQTTIYVLRFPFGDVTLESNLTIGRDPGFCEFSPQLQAFEKVSRKHAILEVHAQSGLSIIDMGSTNGTFVNGTRLDEGARTTVSVGDEVSFSKGLVCLIRRGE